MAWPRDPLVFFVVAGACLFFAAKYFDAEEIPYDVVVADLDIKRLNDQWTTQMRRAPATAELAGLVEQFVKEEIYYREARRIGLDVNDTIVRRRLVQKLTFLTEDIATAVPQDESSLREYYQQNIESYRVPEQLSFRHRYFSIDRRTTAEQDALLAVSDDTIADDPFMLQRDYALRSEREIGDLFGRNFSSEIILLEPKDEWQGPIKSAYGWHPIKLTRREPSRIEPFETVRNQVIIDAQQHARKSANERYYQDLKSRYHVTYPATTDAQ